MNTPQIKLKTVNFAQVRRGQEFRFMGAGGYVKVSATKAVRHGEQNALYGFKADYKVEIQPS